MAFKSENIDLTDDFLIVDITDAIIEKDRVKFTVHTKTTLPEFQKSEVSVVRQHEQFLWLHDQFNSNADYAGYLIPPAPPTPDFDSSQVKLQKLDKSDGTMTKEEFIKMKQQLEAEYLAKFKKTVAMHKVFLCRLASHPIFRNDHNFRVFLEYENDLEVRNKNKKEKFEEFMKSISATKDEFLLSATIKDIDHYYDTQKNFLIKYHNHLKDATSKADKMTTKHKDVADSYMKISSALLELAMIEHKDLDNFLNATAEALEKSHTIEARVASDEDFKLSDTLRYYMGDTYAAKRLLYRRLRSLSDYEAANCNLEKARTKNRDIRAAEKRQLEACEKFEQISEKGKEELKDFHDRRVLSFRNSLVELAESEIKHGKAQIEFLKNCIASMKLEDPDIFSKSDNIWSKK